MDEGRCGEVSIMLFLWRNSAFRPVLSPPDLNFWLLFCLTNGHSVNTFAATFLASVVYMTLHGFNLVLSCLLLLLLALFHKTLESYQSLLMKKTQHHIWMDFCEKIDTVEKLLIINIESTQQPQPLPPITINELSALCFTLISSC